MWQQEVRNGGRKIKQKVNMKLFYAVLELQNKGTAFCLLLLHWVMITFYGKERRRRRDCPKRNYYRLGS